MLGKVRISGLEVQCLIGVMRHERELTQLVEVDLELQMDFTAAARTDELSHTWNYARIAERVDFVLRAGQFQLLETAAVTVMRSLLVPPLAGDPRPPVYSAQVSLTKFGVLRGRARPTVTAQKLASALSFVREPKAWGSVDVLHETRRMGLYRLNIAPGATLPNHLHRRMREAEYILDEGLEGWSGDSAARPLEAGETFRWPHGLAHGYHNPSSRPASILCLDAPVFDPDDEIQVPR